MAQMVSSSAAEVGAAVLERDLPFDLPVGLLLALLLR